jgi:HK97 family phage prohead protease
METEIKHFRASYQTRADTEGGVHLTGRPVVYGEESERWFCREVIEPGALDDTDLTDVLLLMNHDQQMIPLARSRHNNKNSTMQLSVDDDGLEIEALIDSEHNPAAAELVSAVSRGDVDGMSFAFTIRKQTWEDLDTDMPLRRITDIAKIFEVSAVNDPAYSQTEISVRDKKTLESVERSLESARAARALVSAEASENNKMKSRAKALVLAKRR